MACAAIAWRLRPPGAAIAVLLFLVYVWTDFPINYAAFGMLPYLLADSPGTAGHGGLCRVPGSGAVSSDGLCRPCLMSLAVLVHLTAAMIVVPAAVLAYLAAVAGSGTEELAASFPVLAACWVSG